MHRILLFAGIYLLLLTGCSKKNEDESLDPQPTGCLLLSESLNDKPYRTYEYNADSLLYRIVQYGATGMPLGRYTFDYDEQKQIIALRQTNLSAPFLNYQYTLYRSGQSKIDSIRQHRITNSGMVLLETYIIEYDSRNRIAKYSWKNSYWRYEYDDSGNVIKWFRKTPDTSNQEIVRAEYGNFDGNPSGYANLASVALLNLVSGNASSKQNPGSFKFYDFGTDPSQTGVVTYIYNEKKLPTEATVSIFTPSAGSTTDVYKFTYKCL